MPGADYLHQRNGFSGQKDPLKSLLRRAMSPSHLYAELANSLKNNLIEEHNRVKYYFKY